MSFKSLSQLSNSAYCFSWIVTIQDVTGSHVCRSATKASIVYDTCILTTSIATELSLIVAGESLFGKWFDDNSVPTEYNTNAAIDKDATWHITHQHMPDLSNRDLTKLEQLRRVQTIRDACKNATLFANQVNNRPKRIKYLYSSKYNFNYCKVPKVGCSFWTQAFTVMNKGASVADFVFSMPRRKIHSNLSPLNRIKFNSKERQNSRSVLISRDPYSRLYSAFVDKILLQRAGLRKIRRNDSYVTNNVTCGAEVTFQEFLHDILKNAFQGKSLNRHWTPIVSLCHPCSVNPFALVKQESFPEDVEFVLNETGVADDELKVILDALHGHRIEATVPGIIYTVLRRKRACQPTRLNVAERIWLSFQIQDYIKDGIPFPVDLINSDEKVVPDFMTDLILKTIKENPLTPEEIKEQRHRYLVNAYNEIDQKTIEDIQSVYRTDFIMFGYPFEPPVKVSNI